MHHGHRVRHSAPFDPAVTMRPYGSTIALLTLLLTACGAPDGSHASDDAGDEPSVVAAGDREDTSLQALAETVRRADALADSVEDLLRPVPLMRPGEEASLRRYLNSVHVARARELGVRVRSAEHRDSLLAEGRLVPLEDSTEYWIVRDGDEGDAVVPHARALLEELGSRFQDRLAEMVLPPYRLEITSTLRTAAGQARLRQGNPNAAAGASSHEFGTTVDIAYSAYAPPAELPAELRVEASPELRPWLDRVAAVTLESVSARKSRELKKILGDVLRQAQADGLVLVIYERLQPVYHVTVARGDR